MITTDLTVPMHGAKLPHIRKKKLISALNTQLESMGKLTKSWAWGLWLFF
jgi:hypothetical protein